MTRRRYWTPAEVARLRELYPNLRTKEVAARLGVGYQRVVSKAYTLGLYKSAEFLAGPLAHRLDGIIGWQTGVIVAWPGVTNGPAGPSEALRQRRTRADASADLPGSGYGAR